MKKNLKSGAFIIATAVLISGCATQSATEANFGDAVREVTMKQTHDIGATLDSEPNAVVGADPYQLENVINAHRERSAQSQGAGYQKRMFR